MGEVDSEAQTRTWPPVGAWVLGGVGVAGVGVGIAFALLGNSKNNDVTAANQVGACAVTTSAACQSEHDAKDAVNRDRAIEIVGFAAGGAALAGAVVWSLVTAGKKEQTVSVVPDFGPGRGGLSLSSSF